MEAIEQNPAADDQVNTLCSVWLRCHFVYTALFVYLLCIRTQSTIVTVIT